MLARWSSSWPLPGGDRFVGLTWEDVDFEARKIHVRRSLVDQVAGAPKTGASRRRVPMDDPSTAVLKQWREQTTFFQPVDWVFTALQVLDGTPFWPGMILDRLIRPVARTQTSGRELAGTRFAGRSQLCCCNRSRRKGDTGTVSSRLTETCFGDVRARCVRSQEDSSGQDRRDVCLERRRRTTWV